MYTAVAHVGELGKGLVVGGDLGVFWRKGARCCSRLGRGESVDAGIDSVDIIVGAIGEVGREVGSRIGVVVGEGVGAGDGGGGGDGRC